MSTSTPATQPSTSYTAELGTVDRILPKRARVWVYRVAVILGALVFVAALVLKITGHGQIGDVTIDPETGLVGLILAGLGALAHVNLSTGPGVLAAIESEVPQVTTIVRDAEQVAVKVKAAAAAHPDLTTMTLKELAAEAKRLGIAPSHKTKAELRDLITAATQEREG
jgi:hypothetical protein